MSAIDSEFLLHPDLISSEVLIQVLKERKIKLNEVNTMTRENLLQLFNKYCLPHPQRKSRNSPSTSTNHESRTQNNNSNNDILISSKLKTTTLNGHDRFISTNLEYNEQANKRLKLTTANSNINMADEITEVTKLKRKLSTEIDSPSVETNSPNKKQRKMISWP